MLKTLFKSLLYSSPAALIFSWMFIYSETGDDFIYQLGQLPKYDSLGRQDLTTMCFLNWFCISLIFLSVPVFLSLKSNTKYIKNITLFDMFGVVIFAFALLTGLDFFLFVGIILYVLSFGWGLAEFIKKYYYAIKNRN